MFRFACFLGVLACFTATGCDTGGKSDLAVFSDTFFQGVKNKDFAALVELSWLDADFIKKNAVKKDVNVDELLKEMRKEYEKDIKIFLHSYEDLFNCPPATMIRYQHELSKVPQMQELEPEITVIWVKKNGKYHGIYIPCILKTPSGYKVMDWLMLSGYEASRKDQLIKRRANLVSDRIEDCKLKEFSEWENVFSGSDNRDSGGMPGYNPMGR